MLDAATQQAGQTTADAPRHQRSRGDAFVALSLRDGRTRLDRLGQSGCGKAMLPRTHGADPEIVFLNTAGGLTGGDRLRYAVDLGPGARACATTQTAERAYASLAGPAAEVAVSLSVGAGGALVWAPQETILFDAAALHRRTVADLTGDASLLMAETVIFGRAAMGEEVVRARFRDWREVRRDGVPVFIEPVEIGADWLRRKAHAALLGQARAMATVCLIAPLAEDRLAGLRRHLPEPGAGLCAAASGWGGKLVLRAVAQDVLALRRLVGHSIAYLSGAPLPRVWQL